MKVPTKRERIIFLREGGKTYDQIAALTGYSKSLISYHLSQAQREKNYVRSQKSKRNLHPVILKLGHYKEQRARPSHVRPQLNRSNPQKILYDKIRAFQGKKMSENTFTYKDVLEKFGDNPTCYLTGTSIDLLKPETYHFDHIVPVSQGGDNSLKNLGLTTPEANYAKGKSSVDDLLKMCRQVLVHNGYTVLNPE